MMESVQSFIDVSFYHFKIAENLPKIFDLVLNQTCACVVHCVFSLVENNN